MYLLAQYHRRLRDSEPGKLYMLAFEFRYGLECWYSSLRRGLGAIRWSRLFPSRWRPMNWRDFLAT